MMRIAAILSAGLVPLFLSTAAAAETSFLVPSTEVSALVLGAQSGIVPPLQYREQVDNARAQLVLDNIHRESSYLNLRNRRNAYLGRLGDVYRTAALVEEIGEAGARVYARSVGYEPIFVGQPGSGRGFDQVYRNGNQIVVIEAKGGGSPLKKYHGFLQGTPEYTEIVAQQTLRSTKASPAEQVAATKVIQAQRSGRLVIEVVRTGHVLGKPAMTSVTTTAGTLETRPISGGRSLPIGAAKVGGGLAGGADVVFQLLDTGKVDWMRAGAFGALGGLSSYSGIRSGSAMQKAIIRNRVALESNLSKSMLSRLTSGLLAGGVASAVFSYGAYFAGYEDFRGANRAMISGVIGTSVGALASTATLTLVEAYGTSSTGAAISSLSGAAATNSIMAWLGGGSLASGGAGVAGGSVVLTGGVVVVIVAVGAGVAYLFQFSDDIDERERVEHLILGSEEGPGISSLR